MSNFPDFFQLLAQNVWLYGGAFLLVLSILVFVHEWGHYMVARLCGVRIDTFSIGFGPELFGITDRSGTRWKFSLIPLGGYVKMFGDSDPTSSQHFNELSEEDDQPRPFTEDEKKQAFFAKPVAQRAAVVFAGPAINFLFAIALLAGLYFFYGKPVTPPIAAAIVKDSAAEAAGFQPGDRIVEINGEQIQAFEDIRRYVMIGLDTPMEFTVLRNDQTLNLTATPDKLEDRDQYGFVQSRGMLGILGPSNGINLNAVSAVSGVSVDTPEEARLALEQHLGEMTNLTLRVGKEKTMDYIVFPMEEANRAWENPDSANYNYLIMTQEDTVSQLTRFGLIQSLGAAMVETADITTSTLYALGQMVTGVRPATELGGIIRIGAIAGDMAQAGLIALVTFTALLSINLGLINLFPIPLLDGGHLVFYGIEALRGSPVSEDIQEYAFRFGVVVLVGLMLFANLNDLFHLLL